MLAYAANRQLAGRRESSPNALLVIACIHIAAIAALMSAKMDLPQKIRYSPIIVDFIDPPIDPPPTPVAQPKPASGPATIDRPTSFVPTPPIPTPFQGEQDTGPVTGPVAGAGVVVTPILPKPVVDPIHRDPRLLTPASQLKPPYPASKLLTEEEATLTLRLSINEQGRVVAVEPVGRADRTFLEAARRHLMARWRYQPATTDGQAVASSLTVTLKFMLDG